MMKRALILCVSTVIIMCSMMTACSKPNKEIKDTVNEVSTSTEQTPSNTPTSDPKQETYQETSNASYDNEKKNDIIGLEDPVSNEAAPIPTEPTTPEPTEVTPTDEPVTLEPSEPSKSEESEMQENKPEQKPEPTPTQKPVSPEPSKNTEPTSKPSKKPEPTPVPTKKPTPKPEPTPTPTPKPTETPKLSDDFENTEGKGDPRNAGAFRTSSDKLVVVNKDVDYLVNLENLNDMLFKTYGLTYTPRLSKSGLDGSVATLKYKSDTNRYGIEIFGWRHSYDSNTAENNALNAVLETFYFLCGDKKVAYALWSFIDAANIYGYANTDDFGFKDTDTFKNGFSAIMNDIEVDITYIDGKTTIYFK